MVVVEPTQGPHTRNPYVRVGGWGGGGEEEEEKKIPKVFFSAKNCSLLFLSGL